MFKQTIGREKFETSSQVLFGESANWIRRPSVRTNASRLECRPLQSNKTDSSATFTLDKENAERAMNNLAGKKYNNKEIKMIFIPEEFYKLE